MHSIDVGNQFPTVEIFLQDFQLIESSLIVLNLMLTAKCFLKSGIIFWVAASFGRKGMRLDEVEFSM
jgi:hypothetical protein